jgi:hypothetical protein
LPDVRSLQAREFGRDRSSWCVVPNQYSSWLLKVTGSTVREIAIADKSLTGTTA